jgi:phosphatidylglycerol---prolipoprotein diacylglyceryl transferase
MFPEICKIGPFTFYSYGVMLALAVLLCTFLLGRDARQHNISREVIFDLVFWCVLWGIVGARIFYIFLNIPYFMSNPLEIPMLQKGGLAFQGGFLGGALAGVWFIRNKKLPLRLLLDLSAPYLALGQAIGRVGCFLNGCCYGRPVDWGLYFPVHEAKLHPTQLYEAFGLLLIFVILKTAQRKVHQAGYIFVLYLWLAAIERFTVEFFRADHTTLWLGLSLFQYVALCIFLSGLVLFRVFKK